MGGWVKILFYHKLFGLSIGNFHKIKTLFLYKKTLTNLVHCSIMDMVRLTRIMSQRLVITNFVYNIVDNFVYNFVYNYVDVQRKGWYYVFRVKENNTTTKEDKQMEENRNNTPIFEDIECDEAYDARAGQYTEDELIPFGE